MGTSISSRVWNSEPERGPDRSQVTATPSAHGAARGGGHELHAFAAMAGQPRKPLPEAPPGSLEALATEGSAPWVFLNAAALRRIGHASGRLLGGFTEADWSAYFDGVVVIREEVAPVFDPWQ